MAEGRLLLWGETQVGKTTLLAAGLLANPELLPTVDWTAHPDDACQDVVRHWGQLRRNELIEATVQVRTLNLLLGNGNTVIIEDIRGGSVREPFGEAFPSLKQAGGVLFVTQWKGRDVARHMEAIEVGLQLCQNKKVGLAFTKCEAWLDADDPHWDAPPGWWREHARWDGREEKVLEKFGAQVWPTSAYGFDPDGRPACLLGEFGQVMPYRVSPRNVARPFAWFLQELGLR
jgi:hypothetical protein